MLLVIMILSSLLIALLTCQPFFVGYIFPGLRNVSEEAWQKVLLFNLSNYSLIEVQKVRFVSQPVKIYPQKIAG